MESNGKTREILFVIIAVIAVLLLVWLWYARSKPHAQEDILKSVTAPAGGVMQVPKEMVESVTSSSSKKVKPVSEDVMRSLTAPAAK